MAIMGHSKPERTAEYVQQTDDLRDRLTAVRAGQPPVLVAVNGGKQGAERGTNPRQPVSTGADSRPLASTR